jgi:glycosyltransferase involved in cell wall biosynthesis
MPVSLTIAIPTCNRAEWLQKALKSLVDSCAGIDCGNISVFVLNNASTDNTADVVHSYASLLPNFTCVRHPKNIGGDRNIMTAYTIGAADYNFVLGDDDRVLPETVPAILNALSSNPDLVILNRTEYDASFTIVTSANALGLIQDRVYTDRNCLLQDFDIRIGMISGLVARRALMGKTVAQVRWQDYYVHLFQIYRGLPSPARIDVVSKPLVGCRVPSAPIGIDPFRILDVMDENYNSLIRAGYDPMLCKRLRLLQREASARSIINGYKHLKGDGREAWKALKYACRTVPFLHAAVYFMMMLIPPFVFAFLYRRLYGAYSA